ncbi:MAG: hypothetical protein ABSC37_01790, partial [Xanthobacteraceae bacterium]
PLLASVLHAYGGPRNCPNHHALNCETIAALHTECLRWVIRYTYLNAIRPLRPVIGHSKSICCPNHTNLHIFRLVMPALVAGIRVFVRRGV